MDLEITPEPTEEERAAIAKSLALKPEAPGLSPWANRFLPDRDPEGP
jgi:hypothetical protein